MNAKLNLTHCKTTYKEKLLNQKIQLLEQAIKENIKHPSLDNACFVARAKNELFAFCRGEQ